jgi:hypothetical protein
MGNASVSRPVGVTIISVIAIFQGIVSLAVGIGLVVERNDENLLKHLDRSSDTVAAYGWVAIALGVLALLFGWGLWRGSNVARVGIAILEVGTIASGVYVLVAWDGHQVWRGVEQIVIGLVVLLVLFNRRAQAFFEQ